MTETNIPMDSEAQVDRMAQWVLDQHLTTNTSGLDFYRLSDELWEGTLPDGVVVWEPFESMTPQELAEELELQFHSLALLSRELEGNSPSFEGVLLSVPDESEGEE